MLAKPARHSYSQDKIVVCVLSPASNIVPVGVATAEADRHFERLQLAYKRLRFSQARDNLEAPCLQEHLGGTYQVPFRYVIVEPAPGYGGASGDRYRYGRESSSAQHIDHRGADAGRVNHEQGRPFRVGFQPVEERFNVLYLLGVRRADSQAVEVPGEIVMFVNDFGWSSAAGDGRLNTASGINLGALQDAQGCEVGRLSKVNADDIERRIVHRSAPKNGLASSVNAASISS